MARINVEQKALTDARFARLGLLLVNDEYPEITMDTAQCIGLGRMARLWNECQERSSYTLTDADLVVLLGHRNGAEILIEAGLGERMSKHEVRIKGTSGRIEWLEARRKANASGGRVASENMTPEHRHARAKKAADARWSKGDANSTKHPVSTDSKHDANAPAPALTLEAQEDSLRSSSLSESEVDSDDDFSDLVGAMKFWNNVVAPEWGKRKFRESRIGQLKKKYLGLRKFMRVEFPTWSLRKSIEHAFTIAALKDATWFQFQQFFFEHNLRQKNERMWTGYYDGIGRKQESNFESAQERKDRKIKDRLAGLAERAGALSGARQDHLRLPAPDEL